MLCPHVLSTLLSCQKKLSTASRRHSIETKTDASRMWKVVRMASLLKRKEKKKLEEIQISVRKDTEIKAYLENCAEEEHSTYHY